MPDHVDGQIRVRWVLFQDQLIILSQDDFVSDLMLRDLHRARGNAQTVLGAVPSGDDPLLVDKRPSALFVDARTPDLDMGCPWELAITCVQTTHDLPLGISGHPTLFVDRFQVVRSNRGWQNVIVNVFDEHVS